MRRLVINNSQRHGEGALKTNGKVTFCPGESSENVEKQKLNEIIIIFIAVPIIMPLILFTLISLGRSLLPLLVSLKEFFSAFWDERTRRKTEKWTKAVAWLELDNIKGNFLSRRLASRVVFPPRDVFHFVFLEAWIFHFSSVKFSIRCRRKKAEHKFQVSS